MPISVNCACGKSFKAKDEFLGKKTKCPGCGTVLTIGAAAPAMAASAGSASADEFKSDGYDFNDEPVRTPPPVQRTMRVAPSVQPAPARTARSSAAAAPSPTQPGPRLPVRRAVKREEGPRIHVSRGLIITVVAFVVLFIVAILIQMGPATAAQEWTKVEKDGYDDVRSVLGWALSNDAMHNSFVPADPMKSMLIDVQMTNFVWAQPGPVMWRMPDRVAFDVKTNMGDTLKGFYHTRTGEVEADVNGIFGGSRKITGRINGGAIEAEIDGKKVTQFEDPRHKKNQ